MPAEVRSDFPVVQVEEERYPPSHLHAYILCLAAVAGIWGPQRDSLWASLASGSLRKHENKHEHLQVH